MKDTYEKATAIDPYAATGGWQSPTQKCNNNIAENKVENNDKLSFNDLCRRLDQMNSPNYMKTVSLTELFDTVYISNPPIIDNLLYLGTYLFVGAPKVGKSFLMAQLAYHISNGLSLWEYNVRKCTVLYLALEDGYERLQSRMSRMFGTESTDSLFFAINSKNVNDGLEDQLNEFIEHHQDTRLIIIDTLQKVRESGGGKYSYCNDYEIVTKFKNFGDAHGICLLLVHHTRKQASDDSFDTISGTNGLLGAADGAFVLQKDKRTDNKATLDVVGRDQQDQRLNLEFDREHCIWQLLGAETELWKEPPDAVLEAVAQFITSELPVWSGTATELSEHLKQLDISPNSLTRRLNIKANYLLTKYGISYENTRNHNGRQIKLYLDNNA